MTTKQFYPHKTEGVWQYFLRERSSHGAKCKLCDQQLKTVDYS